MKLMKVGMAVLALLVGGASRADAATITAFEQLEELTCLAVDPYTGCNDSNRDLFRTRQDGANPVTTEDNDATIVVENAVGDPFGRYNDADFSYAHNLSWLSATSFTDATLMIWAYDVNGNNDDVLVGTVLLGTLTNGNGVVTTATFGSIHALIVGNLLTVSIDKSNNDSINVFRSRLTVEYGDGQPLPGAEVPEPASLLLLGAGLAGLAARRRRRP